MSNTNKEPSVKILIGYHKPDVLLKDDILTPIHLGRACAKNRSNENDPSLKWMLENLIGDDTGDNISNENAYYNELTGIYWAWKNYEKLGNPDFIGFMHYRRHFIFKESAEASDVEFSGICEDYYESIHYTKDALISLLKKNKIIYHSASVVGSIYQQYADNHDISQLEDALKIINTESPNLSKTAYRYLKRTRGSFYNLFILPKEVFFKYCEWIFHILKIYVSSHNMIGKRLFISERLTGMYFQSLVEQGMQYTDLSASLIVSSLTVPIIISWENNLLEIFVLIKSHISNKQKSTKLVFYLLGDPDIKNKAALYEFAEIHNFELNCVSTSSCPNNANNSILMNLQELLPELSKVLYVTPKVLCIKSCGEFFRTVNVDDYWILGLPDRANKKLGWSSDLMILNLDKMRRHKTSNPNFKVDLNDQGVEAKLTEKYFGHIHTVPEWMFIRSETESKINQLEQAKRYLQLTEQAYYVAYTYDPC